MRDGQQTITISSNSGQIIFVVEISNKIGILSFILSPGLWGSLVFPERLNGRKMPHNPIGLHDVQ